MEPPRHLLDNADSAQRLDKVSGYRQRGGDPYPVGLHRTHLSSDIRTSHGHLEPGTETDVLVTIAGRVMLKRTFGKLAFVTIQDGGGRIQLLADAATPEVLNEVSEFDLGDWVLGTGRVMTTRKGELSVRLSASTLLAKALRPLPEKWLGLEDVETRSRQRYVDLIVNEEARRVAEARSRVVAELRRQFVDRGYMEVETPVLQTEAGGALARPFSTHHHALDMPIFLRIAIELHLKRLIVGGFEKVFEIGRIFRNEGIDSMHNPEFTMLESYEAMADYHDIAVLVEEVSAACAVAATGSTVITYRGRQIDLTPPYRRVRMVDVVAEAVGEPVGFDHPLDVLAALARRHGVHVEPSWGHGRIIDRIFEVVVADGIWEPTFVFDHPKETSPLARVHRDDPNLTERFELIIAGSEFANAFSELNDPLDQRQRFEQQAAARAGGDQEAHPVDEDFLRALEHGMPPTGGLGIGVDRLVMLLTDSHHIREVILFPTLRPER